jgi:hypothetical protein
VKPDQFWGGLEGRQIVSIISVMDSNASGKGSEINVEARVVGGGGCVGDGKPVGSQSGAWRGGEYVNYQNLIRR